MKKLIGLMIDLCILPLIIFAQQKNNEQSGYIGKPLHTGQIRGEVIDAETHKGVGFATVDILLAQDSSVVTGVLSKENGDFEIDQLPFGQFILHINFIGYNSVYHLFSITSKNIIQNLGNFRLSVSTAALKAVNITAEKPVYSMSIDKKVFDATKSLISAGGDATDVLKQIPGVNVNIGGTVTLRNGIPNIFVDGKRSPLPLDEIPTSSIAKVEVITNPSAKYDAEGASGIINIVLKKNDRPGINGKVFTRVDTRGGYNEGANLSLYRKPFNVSLSYFFHDRNGPYTETLTRHNLLDDNWLIQHSTGVDNGNFQIGRIGLDYFLDNSNTISLNGAVGGWSRKVHENLSSNYLGSNMIPDSASLRKSFHGYSFCFYSGDLSYTHDFKKKGHTLTADADLRTFSNGGNGDYHTQFYDNTGMPMYDPCVQTNTINGSTNYLVSQVDYADPLTAQSKLEAGLESTYRNYTSSYNIFDVDSGNHIFNDLLSTDYTFHEGIYAGYIQYADQINKFGYQLGLRAEEYRYSGSVPAKGATFSQENAKPELYPSVFLSYKFTPEDQVQLNYSRRVIRPSFSQRIPYIDYTNPQNLQKGNPGLQSEYTNSFELNYNKIFGESNFLASFYYRNTHNLITTYTEPYNHSQDTVISYVFNAKVNNSFGAEFTFQTQITNWWNMMADLNLFHTSITADIDSQNISNHKFNWFGKLSSDIKLPNNFDIQFSGNYVASVPDFVKDVSSTEGFNTGNDNAPTVTIQGTEEVFGYIDIGVKKAFLKSKNLSAILSFSDILNTSKSEYSYFIPGLYAQNSVEKIKTRFIRLNLSYTFGSKNPQPSHHNPNKNPKQNQNAQPAIPGVQQY